MAANAGPNQRLHIWVYSTVNPHYTVARYNDKICYADNLTSTETLPQEVTFNLKIT